MCFSFCGTSSPRPPTGAPPLDPAGGLPSPIPPRLCSSNISLKNPLRQRTFRRYFTITPFSQLTFLHKIAVLLSSYSHVKEISLRSSETATHSLNLEITRQPYIFAGIEVDMLMMMWWDAQWTMIDVLRATRSLEVFSLAVVWCADRASQ